jgi:hypothetical protein
VNRTRTFFLASADPFGTNPYGNCQLFSIGTLGSGLRQLTRFDSGSPAMGGACWNPFPPNCSVGLSGLAFQDPVTNALVFESGCDPLHANPFGEQVFAMRPDGGGLRQLTDAARSPTRLGRTRSSAPASRPP